MVRCRYYYYSGTWRQTAATPAVKESGGGLGLAIVRDLTERMGGTVEARHSALGGAEIVVSFPPVR